MLTGHILFLLIIVVLIVQVFGFLCHRIGQQWVIGEILAGLVLGPSLLGLIAPGLETQLFPMTILPTVQTILVLFVGTAMAITVFPVLARLLSEKKMLGTPIGVLALTSASIDDVMAWCLLALVIAIAHNKGLAVFFWRTGLTIIFIAVMLLFVRPLLAVIARWQLSEASLTAVAMLVLLNFLGYRTPKGDSAAVTSDAESELTISVF